MAIKVTDADRINFITQFKMSLEFDVQARLWHVQIDNRCQALGKTPRLAIDQAMRFTRQQAGIGD